MQETENGKLVRVIEVNPVEIRCIECNEVLGESLEEVEVVCSSCYENLKEEKNELQDNIDKIRELAES